MRRRRILFVGFVARMEDTRLPKCVTFVELVRGAGCVGGQGKEWIRCILDNLRTFGTDVDEWTTAAQDVGECRKTGEQGAERFMAKRITAELGLDYLERDGKDQEEDSPYQACSCWFARQVD